MAMGGGRSGLVQTKCDNKNKKCEPVAFAIAESYLKYFIRRDPDFDVLSMSEEQFWGYLHISRQWFNSVFGTDDPDLSEFREFGGKMISWWVPTINLMSSTGCANTYPKARPCRSAHLPKWQCELL